MAGFRLSGISGARGPPPLKRVVRLVVMELPTAKEINPFDDLDGRMAQRRFLGKTDSDAFKMFQEMFEVYQEDLLFMGIAAFLFYFPVAIRYGESEGVRSDPDVASTMLMLMRHRWKHERSSLLLLHSEMTRYCQGVLGRVDSMVIDRNIDGNLKGKYERFLRKLRTEQSACT